MKRFHILLLSCMAALACSGDSDDGIDAAPTTPDAPTATPDANPVTPDADPATPDANPVVCNTLDNAAAEITVRRSTAALPTPTGGTIADGTYHLVSDVFYEAAADVDLGPAQGTAEYAGGVVQLVLSVMNQPDVATTSEFTTNGTGITMTQTCPNELSLRLDQYSSDGTTLELHYTEFKRVQTFMRQ